MIYSCLVFLSFVFQNSQFTLKCLKFIDCTSWIWDTYMLFENLKKYIFKPLWPFFFLTSIFRFLAKSALKYHDRSAQTSHRKTVNPLSDKSVRQFPDRSVHRCPYNRVSKSHNKIAKLCPDRSVSQLRDKFAQMYPLKIANKHLNKTVNRLDTYHFVCKLGPSQWNPK